jgi:hypothetical protein
VGRAALALSPADYGSQGQRSLTENTVEQVEVCPARVDAPAADVGKRLTPLPASPEAPRPGPGTVVACQYSREVPQPERKWWTSLDDQ